MAARAVAGRQPGDGRRSRRAGSAGQDLDRDAAELRVERLELSAAVRPLEDALRDAAGWLEGKNDYRGEIYVFTDLAAEAWPAGRRWRASPSARRVAGGERVSDRRRRARADAILGSARCELSSQQLAPGGLLQLDTELHCDRRREPTTNEVDGRAVSSANGGGKPEKRGQQVVAPARRLSRRRSSFRCPGLELGTHQGYRANRRPRRPALR